jgi:hypothetical protein
MQGDEEENGWREQRFDLFFYFRGYRSSENDVEIQG